MTIMYCSKIHDTVVYLNSEGEDVGISAFYGIIIKIEAHFKKVDIRSHIIAIW